MQECTLNESSVIKREIGHAILNCSQYLSMGNYHKLIKISATLSEDQREGAENLK
jgi:hypothetical protein